MAKRRCCSPSRVSKTDPIDSLLESFLSLSSLSLGASFDRLVESRACDSDQIDLIEHATRLGSALLATANRSQIKLAQRHNSVTWPLPSDLTIKIFSMMDTQSVCHAATTCSFLRKCAEDPLCYSNIDLTTESPKVNDRVVSTMIRRAGKVIMSLKLGIVPGKCTSRGGSRPLMNTIRTGKKSGQGSGSSILTRSCLRSLSEDGGAPGAHLKRLHLYNIEWMDNAGLGTALSDCPSLHDLEIVGLYVGLRQTLESLSIYCHLIERLHIESSDIGGDCSLKLPTCHDLVSNCPHLNSLALKGFKLRDKKVHVLVKGLRKLKYVDLSTSDSISGTFLRDLGTSASESLLEVLILRDCMHLKDVEVSEFLSAVIGGDFKLLRHFDISNREGLVQESDWYIRCNNTSFIPFKQLFERRPGFCLLAEFPQGSIPEYEDLSSDDSFVITTSASHTSSHSSDGAMHTTSTDSSYNNDSDEMDYL